MAKRDDGLFDEFMRSSSPRLLRLAWLLTGGASSAEDLVQETLERVYVAWPRIEPGGTHNYARRILVNLHTDTHRRRWRENGSPPRCPRSGGPTAPTRSPSPIS